MKFYPEIILDGKSFSPKLVSEKLGIDLEMANEAEDISPRLKRKWLFGYGIVRAKNDESEGSIEKVINDYVKIKSDSVIEKTIENESFNLIVEALQGNIVVKSRYLQLICENFEEVNIDICNE